MDKAPPLIFLRAAVDVPVMLQRNAVPPQHAHLAHATVVGIHTLCCGLPIAAVLAAALTGAASAGALLPDSFVVFHHALHAYEPLIAGLSGILVAAGAWMEVRARRARASTGFPWLFALSVFCFFANVGVVLAHRA
jgi:hypothetical protein